MTPEVRFAVTSKEVVKRAAVPIPFVEPVKIPVEPPPATVVTVAFEKTFRSFLPSIT